MNKNSWKTALDVLVDFVNLEFGMPSRDIQIFQTSPFADNQNQNQNQSQCNIKWFEGWETTDIYLHNLIAHAHFNLESRIWNLDQ